MSTDMTGWCALCRAGSHNTHNAALGGICVGCACPVTAADRPSVTDNALAEAWDEGYQDGLRQGGEGEDGPRYVNPYRAADRAETTTATDEDAARVLDDVIQHLRKVWSTGHDEAREVIDTAEELLAQALPHLATARTRPTRDKLDRVISDGLRKHGAFRTDLIADAVLALFRGGDK